jgi:peptidoglycan pentaglycine glycine transferase (the first glycine)
VTVDQGAYDAGRPEGVDAAVAVRHRARDLAHRRRTTTAVRRAGEYCVEVAEDAEHKDWDEFLQRTPGGHHVQTSLWGQLKATQGWRPVRLLVSRDGAIVAGAQVLIRSLPLANAVAYVPKGPAFGSDSSTVRQVMLDGLARLTKDYRIRHLSVQPPNNGHSFVQPLLDAAYRPSATSVAPVATVEIDVRTELDDILARMRKNHRRYVRHGVRQGVVGRVGTEDDLKPFYRLVVATSQRQGFSPYPLEYFITLWRLFHPRGLIELFLTEYRGELVSGQLAIAFGDRVIAKNSGWAGQHSSLGPNYVMEWTTLQWAKAHGYRYYDLEGIDVRAAQLVRKGEPLPEKLRRTHSFYKLGFGGEVALYPRTYVMVPNRVLRWGYWALFPKLSGMRTMKRAMGRFRTR